MYALRLGLTSEPGGQTLKRWDGDCLSALAGARRPPWPDHCAWSSKARFATSPRGAPARPAIFLDDRDCEEFLQRLSNAWAATRPMTESAFACCMRGNRFHLMFETPR